MNYSFLFHWIVLCIDENLSGNNLIIKTEKNIVSIPRQSLRHSLRHRATLNV